VILITLHDYINWNFALPIISYSPRAVADLIKLFGIKYRYTKAVDLNPLNKLDHMLYSILFITNAANPCIKARLLEISNKSAQWNKSHSITGCMAYIEGIQDGESSGMFIQVIEGFKREVEAIYSMVKHENLHGELFIIKEGYINCRKFSCWKMGYEQLHLQDSRLLQTFFNMNKNMLSDNGCNEDNILLQFMITFCNQVGNKIEFLQLAANN
jgi:hypothetical protein